MRKENGVTLTVLIITIIVMLILAIVTINFVTDGKLIDKAQEAITKYQLHVFEDELKTFHAKKELKTTDDDYRPEGLYAYYDKIVYLPDIYTAEIDENRNIYDILDSLKDSRYDGKVWIEEGKIVFEPGEYSVEEREGKLTVASSANPTEEKVDVILLYDINLKVGEELQYKLNDGQFQVGATYSANATPPSVTVPITKEYINSLPEEKVVVYAQIYNTNTNQVITDGQLTITIPTPPTDIQIIPTENSLTVKALGSTDPNGLGIKGYKYSIDNGAHWTTVIQEGETYTFDEINSNTEKTIIAKAVNFVGFESDIYSKIGKTNSLGVLTIKPSIANYLEYSDIINWTSGNVELTVVYNTANKELPDGYVIEYTFDDPSDVNANWNLYQNPVSVENNLTTLTARLINTAINNEKIGETSYQVLNIDKVPPTIPTNVQIASEENALIVESATGSTDTLSGLKGYQYSINAGEEGECWTDVLTGAEPYTFENLPAGTQQKITVIANDNVNWESERYEVNAVTKYKIHYDENLDKDVLNMPSDQSKSYNEENFLLASEIPTVVGYTFSSWNTQSNGSGTTYSPGSVFTENENIILYAQWTKNIYTITLDNQSATTPGTLAIYERFDDGIYLDSECATYKMSTSSNVNPITLPSKTGYTFKGYYTEQDGSGTKIINENGYLISDTLFAEATTLYAFWTINQYKLDLNIYVDGVKAVDSQNIEDGYSGRIEANLLIDGSDLGFLHEYYEDVDYNSAWSVSQLSIDGETIPYNLSGTVGIGGTEININFNTVRFVVNDSNIGEVNHAEKIVLSNSTYQASGNTITFSDSRSVTAYPKSIEGYQTSFVNWTDSSSNVISSGTISAQTTITANFSKTANTVTIYYYPNGATTNTYQSDPNDVNSRSAQTNTYTYETVDWNLWNVENLFAKTGYHLKSEAEAWIVDDINSGTYMDQTPTVDSSKGALKERLKTETNIEVNLYANWEENKVTLKFYPNGEDVTVKDYAYNYYGSWNGEYCTQTIYYSNPNATSYNMLNVATLYSRVGYHVTNSTDDATAWLKDSPSSNTNVSQDNYNVRALMENGSTEVNLYANWKENELAIYYYPNGGNNIHSNDSAWEWQTSGEYAGSGKQIVKYSDIIKKNIWDVKTVFDRNGYYVRSGNYSDPENPQPYDDAIAWILDEPDSGIYVHQNDDKTDGTNHFENLIANGNATIRLYANWQAKPVYVYYNANGGQVTGGQLVSGSTTEERFYADANGNILDKNLNNAKRATVVNPGATTDLCNYNNKRNSNSGSGFINIIKDGYVGKSTQEWKTQSGNTTFNHNGYITTYDSLISEAEDKTDHYEITLYVNWQLKPIKVYFNVGSGTLKPDLTRFTTGSWEGDNKWIFWKPAAEDLNRSENGLYVEVYDIIGSTKSNSLNINLPNMDNTTYIFISKTGYNGVATKEWKVMGGTDTFDHNKEDYHYSDLVAKATDKGQYYELKLEPNWEPKQLKVVFWRNSTTNGNTTTDTTKAEQTFTYDVANQSFSDKGWTVSGKQLIGWSANPNGNRPDYDTNHSVYASVANSWIESMYNRSSTYNLYAKWATDNYVTYNKNTTDNVSSLPDPQRIVNNKFTVSSTVPTRTGYNFVGWYTNTGGTGTKYEAGTEYTSSTSITLYAKWSIKSLSFDVNTYVNGTKATNTNGSDDGYSGRIKFKYKVNNGTESGWVVDYYNNLDYGTKFKITQVQIDGTAISYSREVTVTQANQKLNVYYYIVSFAANNTNYGTISPTSIIVLGNTSYSIEGDTLTFSRSGCNESRAVVATPSSQTAQYTYAFSSWSSASGTISSATTITANFTRTIRQYYLDLNIYLDNSSTAVKIDDLQVGMKVGGTDQGYKKDYYKMHDYGTNYEAYGVKINGTNYVFNSNQKITGTVGQNLTSGKNVVRVDFETLTLASNDSTRGTVSLESMYVLKNSTYATSGNKLTVSSTKITDGRQATASASSKTGYNTSFSSWSSTSGTISAPTTVTANFNQTSKVFTITLDNQSATTAGTTAVYEKYNDAIYLNYSNSSVSTKMTTSSNAITKPTKTGYTFGGYYTQTKGNGTQLINENGYITSNFTKTYFSSNATIYAKWIPATVSYTVKHWKQKLTGNPSTYNSTNYDLADTQNLTGTTGTSVTPARKNYTGFTAPNAQTKTINADGSTVVNYYYTRNKYNFSLGSASNVSTSGSTASGQYYYGATITLKATPNAGYNFNKWESNKTSLVANKTVAETTFTMPAGDITMTPKVTAGTVSYTVKHWKQKTDGTATSYNDTNYDLADTQNLTGTTGTKVTPSRKSYTGFTIADPYKDGTEITIRGDGKSVVNYYYRRNTYKIKYDKNDGTGTMANSSHVYGVAKTLTANSYTRTGYTFNGWNKKADGTGTSYSNKESVTSLTSTDDAIVTLYAQWKPNTYTVRYNSNGGTGSMSDSEHTYGEASQLSDIYNSSTKKYKISKSNYVFDGWNKKADGTGTSYANKASVSKLTTTNNGIVNLYAQWKPVPATIKEKKALPAVPFYGASTYSCPIYKTSRTYSYVADSGATSNMFCLIPKNLELAIHDLTAQTLSYEYFVENINEQETYLGGSASHGFNSNGGGFSGSDSEGVRYNRSAIDYVLGIFVSTDYEGIIKPGGYSNADSMCEVRIADPEGNYEIVRQDLEKLVTTITSDVYEYTYQQGAATTRQLKASGYQAYVLGEGLKVSYTSSSSTYYYKYYYNSLGRLKLKKVYLPPSSSSSIVTTPTIDAEDSDYYLKPRNDYIAEVPEVYFFPPGVTITSIVNDKDNSYVYQISSKEYFYKETITPNKGSGMTTYYSVTGATSASGTLSNTSSDKTLYIAPGSTLTVKVSDGSKTTTTTKNLN